MAANHRLAIEARDLLCRTAGTSPLTPDDSLGSMAAVELPADLATSAPQTAPESPPQTTYPADPLHERLFARDRIEVPVYLWPPVPQTDRPTLRLLRVSAQAYNVLADYERLAQALHDLVAAPAGGH